MKRLSIASGRGPHWAVALTLFAVGCSVNPATGERQLILIGEGSEIRMGREADGEITASLGAYNDPGLQAYLTDLGNQLAATSERPNLPWSFKVVDDPIVNAFALPGGFIYITRGIMAHFNSEAQLASVVGHEIGHVTGRHSVEQLSRAQLAQVGLVAGALVVPEQFQAALGAASVGLQLMFLRFGRDDERQADDLGLRYLDRAGYDPREMPQVFAMLGRASAAAGGGRVPEWLSTHPNPEDREQRILQAIAAMGTDFTGRNVSRASYLDRLDGMVFGADPRDGFFEGTLFMHPRMRFSVRFPEGWHTQNQRQAVVGVNEEQNAIVQLSLSSQATPDAAAQTFMAQEGITGSTPRRTTINRLPAVTADFQATTEQSTLGGSAVFIAYDGNVYQLLGYGTTDAWQSNRDIVQQMFGSFGELRDRDALNAQPMRIDIVTVPRAMTLQQFATQYPSEVSVEQLALMNQLEAGAMIPVGTRLKRVVR
jgi:predicted Zn-dependent protease